MKTDVTAIGMLLVGNFDGIQAIISEKIDLPMEGLFQSAPEIILASPKNGYQDNNKLRERFRVYQPRLSSHVFLHSYYNDGNTENE